MRARLDVYEGDEAYQKSKFVAEFSSDLERLSSELKNVLFFETSDFEDNEEFNMCSLILETVGRIDVLASGRNINIEPKCETMFVDTKKKMFRKLFAALLENAVTYAKEGSKIEITLNQSERTLGIKNQKGGEKYMFSSKIGERILKRVSSELGFLYEISDADGYYEVNLRF
jgi:K+-sensing histidine kinase KdpD